MRSLLMILSSPAREEWARSVVAAANIVQPVILTASPAEAAHHLAQHHTASPSHIVLDIGQRGQDVLEEIDILSQQCEPGTRVIAVGDTNDIVLYRGLLARGVLDYLPMPAQPGELIRLLTAPPIAAAAPKPSTAGDSAKRVIVFMSAASGDVASTAALNAAYAISQAANGNTVLVDMDYQFGMVAKNLNLQNQYGIRDLFDHPDRGIDTTLIKRMVAQYGKLHVITAPAELSYLPPVNAEAISELVATLKLNYDNIILDMPHVWVPWVVSAIQQATHLVLVAQLWLKSVSHAARMMRVIRELNIPMDRVIPVINRSGAKFKEAIEGKDFERVCGAPIRYTLANDIRTVVEAEASARTIMELEPSNLSGDIQRLARGLCGLQPQEGIVGGNASRGGLFARLKG